MSEVESQDLRCPGCNRLHQEDGRFCPLCGYNLSGLLESQRRSSMVNQIVADRYRVRKVVGRGGMGVVYQVEHILMGKVMAMKVLHPKWKAGSHQAKRFRQEIRVVSRLSHVNTVSVFDCGETKEGSLYIVMEYLSGHDLEWLLQGETFLSCERAANIGRQVCSSLAEAHARGIVHRDIKPANIFLLREQLEEDFVKVLDFGIAKLIEPGEENFTEAGLIVGTPYYMSPEQARGSNSLGPATDTYSLGVVLYELVTGRLPFEGQTVGDFIEAHLRREPPPPSQVAEHQLVDLELEGIILRAMQKDPRQRFSSIAQMKSALIGYLERLTQRRVIASPLSMEMVKDASIGVLATLDAPAFQQGPITAQFQRETVATPSPPSAMPNEGNTLENNSSEVLFNKNATTVEKGLKHESGEVLIVTQKPPANVMLRTGDEARTPSVEWGADFNETVPAEMVASRADWDRVERRWRWRSRVRSLVMMLVFLGAFGAAGYFGWEYRAKLFPSLFPKRTVLLEAEREPNNNVSQATPIRVGPVISGELGERLRTARSDRDWYTFSLPKGLSYLLSISVQPPPTVDVELGLYRVREIKNGYQITRKPVELLSMNNNLRGGAESVRSFRLRGGQYFILIRELVIPGEAPQEFKGKYNLRLRFLTRKKFQEVEPNDQMGSATKMLLKETHNGFHDRVGDIDFYQLQAVLPRRKRRYMLRIHEVPKVQAEYRLLTQQGRNARYSLRRYRKMFKLSNGKLVRRRVREYRFFMKKSLYLRVKTIKGFNQSLPYQLFLERK